MNDYGNYTPGEYGSSAHDHEDLEYVLAKGIQVIMWAVGIIAIGALGAAIYFGA